MFTKMVEELIEKGNSLMDIVRDTFPDFYKNLMSTVKKGKGFEKYLLDSPEYFFGQAVGLWKASEYIEKSTDSEKREHFLEEAEYWFKHDNRAYNAMVDADNMGKEEIDYCRLEKLYDNISEIKRNLYSMYPKEIVDALLRCWEED